MSAATAGAFDDEVVHILHWFGVAQDIVIPATDVAAEKETKRLVLFGDVEDDWAEPESSSMMEQRFRVAKVA